MARKPNPREMPDLTREQRRDNWWRYHWLHVLIAVLALITLIGTAWEHFSQIEADCSVALVTRYAPTAEELAALQAALISVMPDVNGDGDVMVEISDIQIDYTSTALDDAAIQKMTANVDKLNADFYTNQSGLFILDDPENFQLAHHALRYTDGTEPAGDEEDWENMVRPWEDSPILEGLTFRNLDMGSLFLGRRIGRGFDGEDALWTLLFPKD